MKLYLTLPLLIVLSLFFDKPMEAPLLENSWQHVEMNEHATVQGPLILVNKSVELQNDPTDLVNIADRLHSLVEHEQEVIVQSEVVSPLLQMLMDANEAGFNRLKITSSFRSGELQERLYEQIGEEFALPRGHSEHQTGLAVDISITYGKIEGTKEAKWLAENGPNYGFILRYPEHKTDITGIQFEPWHFRYVGLPHSQIMQQKDLVLEEYIEFLRKEKTYIHELGDVYYTIEYVESSELNDQIMYPWYVDFQYSGSNEGGIITTSTIRNPYQ